MNIVCKIIGHNYQIQPHPPMPMSELDKAMLRHDIFPPIRTGVEIAHYNMQFSYCDRCGKKE